MSRYKPPKRSFKKLRKLNIATHRDLGYFFSTLIIIYCISGIALNHVDDWNPDFIITKSQIDVPSDFNINEINPDEILKLAKEVGEADYKIYDKPTPDQVKVYFEDATLHINTTTGKGDYERVHKRHVFYQSNLLHRNSIKGWKWVSDVFAFLLILISITGIFVLKGKKGIKGRGKWFILAGALLPIIAWILFACT